MKKKDNTYKIFNKNEYNNHYYYFFVDLLGYLSWIYLDFLFFYFFFMFFCSLFGRKKPAFQKIFIFFNHL